MPGVVHVVEGKTSRHGPGGERIVQQKPAARARVLSLIPRSVVYMFKQAALEQSRSALRQEDAYAAECQKKEKKSSDGAPGQFKEQASLLNLGNLCGNSSVIQTVSPVENGLETRRNCSSVYVRNSLDCDNSLIVNKHSSPARKSADVTSMDVVKGISRHEPFNCTFSDMGIINERHLGFYILIPLKFKFCNITETLRTECAEKSAESC
ncbi:hypothetical protein PR048_007588 [Dryococelus australis]|uniref:Uncharacterized protein n=1 Tax=Dryococelus australis TaxID=614101 RepID=A0ABQ9HUR6_9NEOP|nr:hypothetical protein PR048_007588 [Dryococelus australis]